MFPPLAPFFSLSARRPTAAPNEFGSATLYPAAMRESDGLLGR
jgi:hypothetical protein